MLNQHPITPPPELVEEWWGDKPRGTSIARLANQAARWGADQELQACCTAIDEVPGGWADSRHLRHVRRPKPPSLKEQALKVLESAPLNADEHALIRRALEALDD
jgi:hypothetical protein